MNLDKLMSGVGIVIDDALNPEKKDENDLIWQITKQIDEKHIPYCSFYEIPDEKVVENFKDINFVLLDWKLDSEIDSDLKEMGVTGGSQLSESYIEDNIDFLRNLKKNCFAPVFIFSSLSTDQITKRLKKENLYDNTKPNFIFVKQKNDLITQDKKTPTLFNEIENWLKENSSIYVLKEWEIKFRQAKNQLFWSFYEINPAWPNVIWNAYKKDSVDMSNELGGLITKNLNARMSRFSFDEEILKIANPAIKKEDIKKVLEGEKYIKADLLSDDEINTGDIFKIKKDKYSLNIRPACDCIPNRNKSNASIDEVMLYCIPGSKITNRKTEDKYNSTYGNFPGLESDSNAIVFCIDDQKTIDFRFKNLQLIKFSELKAKRIGRLLPPYITLIQQRYALYLQRQGLPRIPDEAVKESDLSSAIINQ